MSVLSKLSILLLSIVLLSINSWAQPEDLVEKSVIEISELSHDFGTVLEGKSVDHQFTISNVGNAPLNIISITQSCGCLMAEMPNKTIDPGGKEIVKLVFDTRGFTGVHKKEINLKTDNLEMPDIFFTMQGEVEPELILSPNRIFLAQQSRSNFTQQEPVKVSLTVHPKSKARIDQVIDFSQLVDLDNLQINPRSASFNAIFREPTKSGLFRERLLVKLSKASRASYNIPIFAKIIDDLQITPPSLSFGVIDRVEPVSSSVMVQFHNQRKLNILNLESTSPAVTANLVSSQDHTAQLKITLDPAQMEEALLADILVTTDDPKYPEFSFNVFAARPARLDP